MTKFILIFQLLLYGSFSVYSQTYWYYDHDNAVVDSSHCYYFTIGDHFSERKRDAFKSFYCKSKKLKSLELFERGSQEGISHYYYPNGQLEEEVTFKAGYRTGSAMRYYENGKPKETRIYYPKETDIKNPISYRVSDAWDSAGISTVKNYNGYIRDKVEEGKIKDGLRDSVWVIYNEEGEKIATEKYDNGKFILGERTNGIQYKELEVAASPKKDLEDFYRFIGKTLRYPANARRYGLQGKVFIKFVIEIDGTLNNIVVVKGFDPECDNEALRVIKLSNKWNPGYRRGVPVRQSYTLPLSFKLAQ